LTINTFNRKIFKSNVDILLSLYKLKLDLQHYFKLTKKEKEFLTILKKNNYCKKQFSFVEVGSGSGMLSLKVLSSFKFSKAFLFDGREDISEKYKKIDKKKLNFDFFNYLIGESKKKLIFNIYSDPNLSSRFVLKKNQYISKNNIIRDQLVTKHECQMYPLDYFKKKLNKNIIISIDVQGGEYEVLKGCKKLFLEGLIKIIILEVSNIEIYKKKQQPIFSLLKKNNFSFIKKVPGYTHKNKVIEYDYIFKHEKLI